MEIKREFVDNLRFCSEKQIKDILYKIVMKELYDEDIMSEDTLVNMACDFYFYNKGE